MFSLGDFTPSLKSQAHLEFVNMAQPWKHPSALQALRALLVVIGLTAVALGVWGLRRRAARLAQPPPPPELASIERVERTRSEQLDQDHRVLQSGGGSDLDVYGALVRL